MWSCIGRCWGEKVLGKRVKDVNRKFGEIQLWKIGKYAIFMQERKMFHAL